MQAFDMDKARGEGRLPHLETFRLAVELGSFTAVARRLGISQAAVSQRIHTLEYQLNRPLFSRRAGRLQLTPTGTLLYQYAQRLHLLQEEAWTRITGSVQPALGELVLGASTIPSEYLLPELLTRFQQRFPQIHVRVHVGNTQQILQQVQRHQVQLGLVGAKNDNPRLQFRNLASDRLVLIVSPKHPWAGRKSVALRELTSQRLIVREPGSGSRACLESALHRAGLALENWSAWMELGSNLAIKDAVQRNLGIAILSEYAVRDWVALGYLVQVPVRHWQATRRFYAAWLRDNPISLPAQLFMEMVLPRRKGCPQRLPPDHCAAN